MSAPVSARLGDAARTTLASTAHKRGFDARPGMPALPLRIDPSPWKGCAKPGVILATHVTAASRRQARGWIAIPLGLA